MPSRTVDTALRDILHHIDLATKFSAADSEAKFWLHDLSVAVNAGFPAHEIGAIIRHLRSQRDILEGKWHERFGN